MEFSAFTRRPYAKWKNLLYRQIDFPGEKIIPYRDALRSVYVNGRVDFAAFEAVDRGAFFSAFQHDHEVSTRVVEDLFIRDGAVRRAFPDGHLDFAHAKSEATSKDRGEFEGILADILLQGGAYRHWENGVTEAKRLACECVEGARTLAPDRPFAPTVVLGAWSQYFNDVAWDYTFVMQFPYDARWFVMCATDTD